MIASSRFDFDLLKIYFMRPYELKCGITIQQPTVGQIIDYGEVEFYSMLNVLIGNPTMYRLQLWENGVDWNKVKDYDLFSELITVLDVDSTRILFGDIDFSKFRPYLKQTDDPEKPEKVLVNSESQIMLDEHGYFELADYLRTVFDIWPKIEKTRWRGTKLAIIEEEKVNLATKKMEGSKQKSVLFPLISACVNHPGFKYNLKELETVGIYQFMDAVRRIRVYENATAMIHGSACGFGDYSKVDKSLFDFMRDLTVNK